MEILCAYISLLPFFLLVDSTCIWTRTKSLEDNNLVGVQCTDNHRLSEFPSWLPENTGELYFYNCNIRTLNSKSFKKFVNLRSVFIGYQKSGLSFNDGVVFQGLFNLQRVSFPKNNITSLPSGLFSNLSSLTFVNLDSNPLLTFPDDLFENSNNLKTLWIRHTRLSPNVLSKIGKGHFGTNIQGLLAIGTPLGYLKDGLFSGLPNLEELWIFGSEIKSIGADFLKGTKVRRLELNHNPIEFINENAFRDSAVTALALSDCQLTSNVTFNGFLKKMSRLVVLLLPNNKIKFVPRDAFTNTPTLAVISLGNNAIANFDYNIIANLSSCTNTQYHGYSSTCFMPCVFLGNNPLTCDCNMALLRSFVEKCTGNFDNFKCAQPKRFSNRSVLSLKINDFCCEYPHSKRKCGLRAKRSDGFVVSNISCYIVGIILLQIALTIG